VNRLLVGRALSLLDPRPGERITDLFCGLGNFTLPIAGRGAEVLGVEGSAGLVARAQDTPEPTLWPIAAGSRSQTFSTRGLRPLAGVRQGVARSAQGRGNRAGEIICREAPVPYRLRRLRSGDAGPRQRGAVHTQGYRLAAAGVVNMFPHNLAHLSSIALFERDQ